MKRMLFNATYPEELRVATVEAQRLINFDIETTSKIQYRGNIYKGIITRVEPSLEACFVDYGVEKQGFLPFKEIDPNYLPESARPRNFAKLTEGTELIVQIEKDERGNKGAALTTYVSLPGRYLVLMPNNSRAGGISRRIDGEERDELKAVLSQIEVPNGMSVIARTAALGRTNEELQWDLSYLCKLWEAIKTAASTHRGSFLIYQESSLVIRSIRDHFSPDISEILIDKEDVYEQAKQFMAHVMPDFVNKIKLYHDDVPLFSRFRIEHQIESAYGRIVSLPSGGSVAIDHTEALTAIDVNSGRANKGSDIEVTALNTNLEAAEEVARQLRLRDLGGLIVVDFIDMENTRSQRELENYFRQQLSLDRARIQMSKLSKFGLLELSRQRLQASLEESTTIPCPRCSGIGSIRGTESTAVHILRIIQEEAVTNNNYLSAMHVQLPVDVATYLLNEKRDDVTKIETRMKVKIVLIPNIHIESPHYKIRKLASDGYNSSFRKTSYDLVEAPDENQLSYQSNENGSKREAPNAMVKNIAHQHPGPTKGKTLIRSLFSKAIQLLSDSFNKNPSSTTTTKKPAGNRQAERLGGNRGHKNAKNTRPVGATRGSHKINAVRANMTTNKPAIEKDVTATPTEQQRFIHNKNDGNRSDGGENSRTNEDRNNNRRPSTRSQNPNNSRARNRPDIRNSENRNADNRNYNNNEGGHNRPVAGEWSNPSSNHQTNSSLAPQQQHSQPVQQQPNIAAQQNVTLKPTNEISKSAVEKIIVRQPYIPKPVDLGNLEMVATTKHDAQANNVQEIVPPFGKHYNDIVHDGAKTPSNNQINYEMVETKNS
jgi:ribonuclease E